MSDIDKEFVDFNGASVVSWWPDHMARSQLRLSYTIGGAERPRIPFGSESFGAGAVVRPCHDCAALKGQLHGFGCDCEQCPACGGQLIGCDCDFEPPDGWLDI
jgi:hypothetical protein